MPSNTENPRNLGKEHIKVVALRSGKTLEPRLIDVEDEHAEKVTESIKKAAYSGKIGDGKIFIYNIDQVIRIRTGEKDSDAV